MRARLASESGRIMAKDNIYEVRYLPCCVLPISIFITATNRDVRYRANHRDFNWILPCIPT